MVGLTRFGTTNLFLIDGADELTARFAVVTSPGSGPLTNWRLDQTWGDDARYVFFPVSQAADFLAAGPRLWQSFNGQRARRVGWMTFFGAPSGPPSNLFSLLLPNNASPGDRVLQNAEFSALNYQLVVPQGCRLDFGDRGFELSFGGLSVPPNLGNGSLNVRLTGDRIYLDVVDETDAGVSRFRGSLQLAGSPRAGSPSEFDKLDIGLRYFRPAFDGETNARRAVISRRFSLFDLAATEAVSMTLAFDALHHQPPTDPDAPVDCYLEFDRNTPQTARSTLRTALGFDVVLRPGIDAADPARFVLHQKPTLLSHLPNSATNYYLAPRGPFRIDRIVNDAGTLSQSPRANRLVFGSSGAEYAYFRPGPFLRFVPYQDAWHLYGPGTPGESPTPRERLTNKARTPWVRFYRTGGSPNYRSQPNEAPLYTPVPRDPDVTLRPRTAAALEIFDFQQVPLIDLANDAPLTFPMAPADGYRPEGGSVPGFDVEYTALEATVLQPVRRDILKLPTAVLLNHGVPAAASLPLQDAVTPQGLLAKLAPDAGFRMEALQLAISEPERAQPAGDVLELLKVYESPDFVRALQGNTIFAVLSEVPNGVEFTSNRLSMVGWQFDISLGNATVDQRRPLLIFKFHPGNSLEELANDRALWAPGLFDAENEHPHSVLKNQTALINYIAHVRAKSIEEDSGPGVRLPHKLYRGILTKLTDPAWNGILAINLRFTGANLPSELRGLSAGIVPGEFYVDHIGVNASRSKTDTAGIGQLSLEKSSLFGLVDYDKANGTPHGAGGAFEFSVDELKALFENSALQQFRAKVRLGVKRAFRQTTTGNDQVIVLGSYEKKNGIDTYTFVNPQEHSLVFGTPATPFVEKLRLRRVQMVTELGLPAGGLQPVTTRFTMSGTLDLGHNLNRYLCATNLGFDNLTAAFAFDLDAAGKTHNSQLAEFQPGLISFDFSEADNCPLSVLKLLPLKLRRFYFNESTAVIPLVEMGFLPLSIGGVDADFDYGFSFLIDLGTLGALAPGLKNFKAELFVGWKVDRPTLPSLGFRLPNGRLQLGIEGILELIVKRFAIELRPSPVNYYAIVLQDCEIRIFGKRFPGEHDALSVYLFPNKDNLLGSPVGWFGGLKFEIVSPDDFNFVGVGQRLSLGLGGPPTFKNVLNKLANFADRVATEGPAALGYSADNQWTAALRWKVTTGLELGAVFNDPNLYALRVDMADLFAFEVVYRKINDELGVYAVELRLPAAIREIEMGAASLTLPIIGIEVYTNGDFRLDLGFPWKLDFSRCFKLQVFPFIGKGGFYIGRLNGGTSELLQGDFPVAAVFGLGLSIGLGKEFDKGIFQFSVSISLYGVLEGALGYRSGNSNALKPDAFVLAGRVGIIGLISGVVDFGIVQASVTIIIEIGMPFRIQRLNGGDVTFSVPGVEANVSVRVEVVVGRICAFGDCAELTVSYSFDMQLSLRFPIGENGGARLRRRLRRLAAAPTEIRWNETLFNNLYVMLHA